MCLNSRNSQMAQKGPTFDEINPYIWWYPEGLGVPETHFFACYSPKCKVPFWVCKLQHQYITLSLKQ